MKSEFTKKEKTEFTKFRKSVAKFTNDFCSKTELDPRAIPYVLLEHAFFLFKLFDVHKDVILDMIKTANHEGTKMAKQVKIMHGLSDEE